MALGCGGALRQAHNGSSNVAQEVLFNFPDRKVRQVLIYLGNHACLHI
jgi:hypothetical protein